MGQLSRWMLWTGVALALSCFGYVALRGTLVTLWRTPTLPHTYFVEGADQRAMSVVLMPGNYMYVAYSEPQPFYSEIVLLDTRGEYGTHYVWNLWNVNKRFGWFDIRVLDDGQRPASVEASVVDKFSEVEIGSVHQSHFPETDERWRFDILISDETLVFQDTVLKRVPNEPELLIWLEEALPLLAR